MTHRAWKYSQQSWLNLPCQKSYVGFGKSEYQWLQKRLKGRRKSWTMNIYAETVQLKWTCMRRGYRSTGVSARHKRSRLVEAVYTVRSTLAVASLQHPRETSVNRWLNFVRKKVTLEMIMYYGILDGSRFDVLCLSSVTDTNRSVKRISEWGTRIANLKTIIASVKNEKQTWLFAMFWRFQSTF